MCITHICSWVPRWQGSCFSCLWMLGTFVTHVVTDLKRRWRNSYQEGIPIFQLALSSPVNWDSKAQNDRWEKRGKMSLGAQDYGGWHRIGNFTTVAENCEWSLEILRPGPGIRIQEFSWNWRWRSSANSSRSAYKTHTKRLGFFLQNKHNFGCLSWGRDDVL